MMDYNSYMDLEDILEEEEEEYVSRRPGEGPGNIQTIFLNSPLLNL